MSHSPIAVCIIVEDLPVPFDRRVWQEACALRDAGYRVTVICPKRDEFRQEHERREGIEIHRHALREGSRPFGYLFEYAWALTAEFRLALKVFGRTRFKILHACNPPDTIFLIARFFKLLGVRFIFDHHDLNPELYEAKFGKRGGLFYRLLLLAERMTYRTADASIATNESYREIAIQRGGMAPDRAFIVRSAPDLSRMPPAAPRAQLKRGRRFLVVYLGTMGPQEGVDLLLEAAAHLAAAGYRSDTVFALIGGGSEIPRLKALSAAQGLDEMVTFTGRIPDEDVAAYLCTADVCVAPDPQNAMNDKSTMNKVLQYMAYGRPVVLFDLTEGRRAAGKGALYARPNDPRDFAAQMARLLSSEALRRELGEAGRERIEKELNWEYEKRQLLKAYKMAVGARSATSGRP
ncbi:MAG: glycosyltransferase family 4 protein [Terriglobia bacterium]